MATAMSRLLDSARVGDLLEVSWVDAMSKYGWDSKASYEKWVETNEETEHFTVGYVVSVSDKRVALVQNKAAYTTGEGLCYADMTSIPRTCIRQVQIHARAGR
jgi:hypothetical protein